MEHKSGFLTFVFAFFPGAGQMYLGYMRRGASLTTLFFGIIGVAAFLNMSYVGLFALVVYMYSFFDTFNLRRQTPQQAAMNPDRWLVDPSMLLETDWKGLIRRYHRVIGVVLVIFGVYSLYQNFVAPALYGLSYIWEGLWWLRVMLDGLSTVAVAAVLILFGLYLLRSPEHSEGAGEEEYVAYKGEKNGPPTV